MHALVVSYEMAMAEITELRRLQWGVMVVDEGHRLKDPKSRLFKVPALVLPHSVLLLSLALRLQELCCHLLRIGAPPVLRIEHVYLLARAVFQTVTVSPHAPRLNTPVFIEQPLHPTMNPCFTTRRVLRSRWRTCARSCACC